MLVGGEWRLRDGRITGVDEAAVLAEGRARGREIVARHDEGFEVGRELLASVRAGWLDAMQDRRRRGAEAPPVIDLLLANARLLDGRLVDLAIDGGRFVAARRAARDDRRRRGAS